MGLCRTYCCRATVIFHMGMYRGKGGGWYSAGQQLSAVHVMSMANPADPTRGAAGLIKSKVEGPALWGNVIAKAGDASGFFDNRPLRMALGR